MGVDCLHITITLGCGIVNNIILELDSCYVDEPTLIPVYMDDRIVCTVSFTPNLNVYGPSYLNENCNMGLSRIPGGRYAGKLVLMFEDEIHPSLTRGEFISEEDAYELCVARGKMNLVKKYNICPEY